MTARSSTRFGELRFAGLVWRPLGVRAEPAPLARPAVEPEFEPSRSEPGFPR
jgi:hypothetical protein